MTKEEAIEKAREFLEKKNLENPDKDRFQWVLSNPKEFEAVWYFDFIFELIDSEDNFAIGGAPGFKINKINQVVENVSWEEYNKFR